MKLDTKLYPERQRNLILAVAMLLALLAIAIIFVLATSGQIIPEAQLGEQLGIWTIREPYQGL